MDRNGIVKMLRERWEECKIQHTSTKNEAKKTKKVNGLLLSCSRCHGSFGYPKTSIEFFDVYQKGKSTSSSASNSSNNIKKNHISAVWSPPKVHITIRKCFRYGSYQDMIYRIIALSDRVQDLYEVIRELNFGRICFHGSTTHLSLLPINNNDVNNYNENIRNSKSLMSTVMNDNNDKKNKKSQQQHKHDDDDDDDSIDVLVDLCSNLQVLEFGYSFKLYKSVAHFLRRALTSSFIKENWKEEVQEEINNGSSGKHNNYCYETEQTTNSSKVEHLRLPCHLSSSVPKDEFQPAIKILANETLRYNTSLRVIDLSYCRLTDADVAALIDDGMKYNTSLQKLILTANGCHEQSITALGNLLSYPNCSLKYLDLSNLLRLNAESKSSSSSSDDDDNDDEQEQQYHHLNDVDLDYFLDLTTMAYPGLELNQSLEEIRLSRIPPLKVIGVKAVLNAIQTSRRRRTTSTRNITRNKDGIRINNNMVIKRGLPTPPTSKATIRLKKIVLDNTIIISSTICQMLLQLPGLKYLTMSRCHLSGKDLEVIGETFLLACQEGMEDDSYDNKNKNIQEQMHNRDNENDDDSRPKPAKRSGETTANTTTTNLITVQYLNLDYNFFKTCTVNEMTTFVQGIASSSSSLRCLSMEATNLTDKHAVIFGTHLPAMKKLMRLNLDLNCFDRIGARSLVNGLKENKVIRTISVATDVGNTTLDGGPLPKIVNQFFDEYEATKYYLSLNRCGRVLLECGNSIPDGLWPLIIERIVTMGKLPPVNIRKTRPTEKKQRSPNFRGASSDDCNDTIDNFARKRTNSIDDNDDDDDENDTRYDDDDYNDDKNISTNDFINIDFNGNDFIIDAIYCLLLKGQVLIH